MALSMSKYIGLLSSLVNHYNEGSRPAPFVMAVFTFPGNFIFSEKVIKGMESINVDVCFLYLV